MGCSHSSVECLNHYELIRKYRCDDCGGVMMCECDRAIGERFLPHQLAQGCVLETQERVRVTLGFVENVCRECRGLKPEPHPKAELPGQTSKIRRYYWREIAFRTYEYFAARAEDEGFDPRAVYAPDALDLRKQVEREVIDEIKRMHRASPKYDFREPSQQQIIDKYGVQVERLDATFVPKSSDRGAGILDDRIVVSAEEFAARHFRKLGWSVTLCESRPFHVLFGVFMRPLIQDPEDPLCELRGFATKIDYPARSLAAGQSIWQLQPRDFGTPGYAERRGRVIDDHLSTIERPSKKQFLGLFEEWLDDSELLRDYLWAHDSEDVSRARIVLEVLPPDVVLRILRYLVGHYWGRFTGWPDLLAYRAGEFLFAEVKASKDKLSGEQKRWIADNALELDLPFRLVKIHRTATAKPGREQR